MKTLILLMIYPLLCSALCGEPAPLAGKEFRNFDLISGFHSHVDKASGFEFRILEVDGSATVAMNPIYLYLVVTNNSSGNDLQSTIVMLPSVSSIKQIRFSDQAPTIQIDAVFDLLTGDVSRPKTDSGKIEISIPIKDGKLPETIDATVVK